jgi:hypothetical protein
VNDFVAECRREWQRLRVPDCVADEMAAELAADLGEAEKEGVPADEVLGGAASDPRSFAASWAAERGFVRSASTKHGAKYVLAAAIAGLAAVAISGAVLLIVAPTSSSGTRQALAPRFAPAVKTTLVMTRTGNTFTIAPPPRWIERETVDSSDDTPTIGLVLLIVGLVGIVPLSLVSVLRSHRVGTRSP